MRLVIILKRISIRWRKCQIMHIDRIHTDYLATTERCKHDNQSNTVPCLRNTLGNSSTERQQRSITTAPLIIPTCLPSRNVLSYVINMFILVEDLELFIRSVCVNDLYDQLKRWTLAAAVHNEQQKKSMKSTKKKSIEATKTNRQLLCQQFWIAHDFCLLKCSSLPKCM